MQIQKIQLDRGKRAPVFPLQNTTGYLHAGIKFCQRAFTLPRDLPPFLCKLFDQFDSFKQSTALCVFRANFPLHRWRISVYFSFIFNGRPFRHWTHEPSSSCTRRSVVALSSSEASPDGEGKRLEVEVVLSLSMIPWLLKRPSLLWGQDVPCGLCLWSSRTLHWTDA